MYKRVIILMLIFSTFRLYSFDINKDNFCTKLSAGEYIVAYNDKIYQIDWFDVEPTIYEVINRPSNIENEYGYNKISFENYDVYLVEINGEFIISMPSDFILNDFSVLYGQTQIKDVITSSELIEITRKDKIEYKGVNSLFRVYYEKEIGFTLLYNGIPWIPDLKNDKKPFIEIHLEEPVVYFHIIPGFLDFNRQNLFKENSRVKLIEILDLDNNLTLGEFALKDEIAYTSIFLKEPVQNIRVNLLDYYPGTKYDDPCISSIMFISNFSGSLGDYGQSMIERLKAKNIFN